MTPLEILHGARDLISDPDRWVQGWMATDKAGNECSDPCSSAAERWCVVGAIIHTVGRRGSPEGIEALRQLQDIVDGGAAGFNDNHAHSDVLAVVDEAIAVLEQTATKEK